ncbi:ABC-type amino acid transport/signal transduction systems, periplasmic component/domain [Hahella chejuensis KCTC 2396]|uniref:ABC-type amino acid transport/signal transduction systems, periplasmic component/domain n=1 Tax=Hahella chejuensis (strain KCTC 2396) TaxID=349521 RepID=Q2SGG0_HAHCH|nr:transporter substrate-binding domain-containing protein [Hahella chejuensis]ABC30264.1 ABC-type amino acid transport/signal transduction systems, periplasmic component/domain [Hahella chejuensis KCTC 2396]
MKHRTWKIMGVLALIVSVMLSSRPVFAEKKALVVAGDEEKKGGYLVEITQAAFSRVGYATDFRFVPWSRALTKSIAGEYDVLLAAYYTHERAEKLLYSKPIGVAEVMLLQRKGSDITYRKLEDLKPYRIGHISNSKVSPEFDKAEAEYLNIEYAFDAETNIRKLLAGRLDLMVEKKQRIVQLVNTEFASEAHKLAFVNPPLHINYFHNCVTKINPDHQKIIHDFNLGLDIIRKDGTEARILKKHGEDKQDL